MNRTMRECDIYTNSTRKYEAWESDTGTAPVGDNASC